MSKNRKSKFFRDPRAVKPGLPHELITSGLTMGSAVGAGYLVNTTFARQIQAKPMLNKWIGAGLMLANMAAQCTIEDKFARAAAMGVGTYGAMHTAAQFLNVGAAKIMPTQISGLGAYESGGYNSEPIYTPELNVAPIVDYSAMAIANESTSASSVSGLGVLELADNLL